MTSASYPSACKAPGLPALYISSGECHPCFLLFDGILLTAVAAFAAAYRFVRPDVVPLKDLYRRMNAASVPARSLTVFH